LASSSPCSILSASQIDVTVNAPQSGTIVERLANEEDTVTGGQDLFKIEPGEGPSGGESSSSGGEKEESQPKKDEGAKKDEGGSSKKKEQEETKKKEESQQADKQKKEQNSPSEQQKDDKKPPTQGKKDDKPSPPPKKESSPSSSSPSESSKPAAGSRGEHRVKMNRMRLRIAERLKQSQNTAASLTTFNEIDMSGLMAFRARHKDRLLKEQGIKLGFMGAFTKACALALKEIPAANASIEGDGLGDTIVYRDYVDISVAVSTGKGLVTPVIRNVESMSIMEIENEIAELGKKVSWRDMYWTGQRMIDCTSASLILTASLLCFPLGARQQANPRGHDRRLLYHLQRRRLRLPLRYPHPQRPSIGHSGYARHQGEAMGRRRRGGQEVGRHQAYSGRCVDL
jgi:2-oxoglutarate dehydrogenase E2 component (dihydrolipoamide succinyltransferase)